MFRLARPMGNSDIIEHISCFVPMYYKNCFTAETFPTAKNEKTANCYFDILGD